MKEEIIRGEKVRSNPIPERKYEQFKFKLEEISGKYAERNKIIFLIGVATGYRLQDIVNLTIGEIKESLEDGKFVIREQKQYKAWLSFIKRNPKSNRKPPKPREAIIKSNLRKVLVIYCKGKAKSQYAFESNKKGCHISQQSYSKILAEVGKSLGIKNISGHSLRKTYATRLYEYTRDLEFVRRSLGHKSIETTKVYLGIEDEIKDNSSTIADDRL